MGGKKGIPSAKQKAAEKEKDIRAQQAARKEDEAWEAAGEGKKSKAQAKKANKDEERQDAQAKKAEARRLAEEEAAALAASTKKPAAQKVTKYELEKQALADKERSRRETVDRDMESRREVDEGTYAQMVETVAANTMDGVDARNVDQALQQLGLEEKPKMKFSQYMERELPALKLSKPSLKAPQYKDILWKKWQRSPENPLNQK